MKLVTLGFSPCPNDTFIFDALVHGRIESKVSFAAPLLEDVETLNNWAMEGRLDVTKLSFHALGYVLQDYCVLQAGSALGRGCGPLVVAARQLDLHADRSLTVAVPGKYTTASLLFRLFAPQCTNLVEMRFEKIIDSVAAGTVDAGVIIHESRFTYGEKGLHCLQDLGSWWEATSGFPIPLGCIAAKRSLGRSTLLEIDSAVRKSLEYASAYPRECLPYVHRYAQEIEDDVVQDHINLYVNDFSLGLGTEGTQAIEHFLKCGRQAGILPHSRHALTLI